MQLALLLILPSVVLSNRYIRQPYSNDTEFNQNAKFGENKTLECEDRFIPDPEQIRYWILPDNRILQKGETHEIYDPIDKWSYWTVEVNGRLHLSNIREAHFGVYHCVVLVATPNLGSIKKGLNYNGPYFGDLWPVYRNNVMIGGIASAVFLVIAATLYTIHRFKYKDEEEEDEQMRAYLANGTDTQRYENVDIQPIGNAHPTGATYDNPTYMASTEDATQL